VSWLPDWTWAFRDRVYWIWLVVAVVIGLAVLELASRDALGRFLSPIMQRRLVTRPSTGRVIARLVLIGAMGAAGVGALMQPRATSATEIVVRSRVAADVMVVLDVSRSMLAEDVAPSRLARAKAEIAEMVRQLPGQRVGLVAFAGRAALMCPLTPDASFFNLALRGVDTNSVSRGGTAIGTAIRTAVASFPTGPGAKLIVLITDGEDHDSYPVEAAQQAKAAGIRILAVGLGSEEGSPIVITDPKSGARTELIYDGKPVISRLDGDTLRKMALDTGGAYVPAGTAALDLESIVKQNITPILRAEADSVHNEIPAERFQWLVLGALLALVAAVAIGSFAGRQS